MAAATAALAEAYGPVLGGHVLPEVMVFVDEYPLENVGSGGRLQADNAQVVEAVKRASA